MFAPSPPPTLFSRPNTLGAPGLSHQCQYSYNYRYAPMQSSPLAMSSSSSNPFATQQPQPASFSFQPQPQLQSQTQAQAQPQGQSQQTGSSYYATRYTNTIANPLASRRAGKTAGAGAAGTGRGKGGATSPEARAHRRTLFLNRIKQDRDAGRFEARGEQFVLMEDVAEERRRREAMERRAERIMRGFGIEEEQGFNLDEGMFFLSFLGLSSFIGSGVVANGNRYRGSVG